LRLRQPPVRVIHQVDRRRHEQPDGCDLADVRRAEHLALQLEVVRKEEPVPDIDDDAAQQHDRVDEAELPAGDRQRLPAGFRAVVGQLLEQRHDPHDAHGDELYDAKDGEEHEEHGNEQRDDQEEHDRDQEVGAHQAEEQREEQDGEEEEVGRRGRQQRPGGDDLERLGRRGGVRLGEEQKPEGHQDGGAGDERQNAVGEEVCQPGLGEALAEAEQAGEGRYPRPDDVEEE